MAKLSKKSKICLGVLVIMALGIGGTVAITSQQTKSTPEKEIVVAKKENPFQKLAKSDATQIKNIDKIVLKLVDDKSDGKTNEELAPQISEAEKNINSLNKVDAIMVLLRQAYTDKVEVIKTPILETLQTARTSAANVENKALVSYLNKTYDEKMITVVARAINSDEKTVRQNSMPLTKAQVIQKEAEEKAKKEALAAADKAAADKAAADKAAADKAAADKAAADKAAADKAAADKAAADKAAADATAAEATRQANEDAQQASNQQSYDDSGDYQEQAGTSQGVAQGSSKGSSSDGMNQAERDHQAMTDAYEAATAAGFDGYIVDPDGSKSGKSAAEGYVMGEWQP